MLFVGTTFLVACGSEKPAAHDGSSSGSGGTSGAAGVGGGGGGEAGAGGMAGTVGTAGTSGTAGDMDGGIAGASGMGGTMADAATADGSLDHEAGSDGSVDQGAGSDGSVGDDAATDTSVDTSSDTSADTSSSDGPTADASTSDGSTVDASATDASADTSSGCKASSECNDSNPCTDDTCDVGTGACSNTPNTNACDDGNACTTVDQCSAGQCVGGGAMNCDDHNVCTDDACNPTSGQCGHAPNTRACDDGNACTTVDQCSGGACQGSVAPSCDDQNVCTTDSCDPTLGCIHPLATCDDSSTCTNDSCDPTLGCQFQDNGSCAAPDAGSGVDAGTDSGAGQDAGTSQDAGGDVGAPGCVSNAQCDDHNPCTNDVCNGSGACEHADVVAASFAALSATGSAGGDPSQAIDGNPATSFSPTAANPRWIYVDLGTSKRIGRVQLDWGVTTYGGSYTIQVAGDDGNDATTLAKDAAWTSIYTQSLWDNATGHSDDITGLNAVGRYVRVYHWMPKTNFALTTTALNLAEITVSGTDAACVAPAGACAESTVPSTPTTYENDGAGNTCAVVNGGAACATTTGGGIAGTATVISARGVLSFANVDGASGGAATLNFNAAGASNNRTAAAVYVKYEDRTEQGYGPITTTSTIFGATQSVQVWLKSGAHNTIELRDTAGAADVNGLPIVDSVTVTRLAGANKTCEGTPFVVDSFEGAPTNDWNLSNATGVTSGDRRGISKAGTPNSAFQGNATTVANPPTGDLCLRMDVTNYSWTTKLANMSGLENAYVQLILAANAGSPTITLALTADGVNFSTPVVLTANNVNTNNGYGVIRNNMANADSVTSKVLVPVAAFGLSSDTLKHVDRLRATISSNIWRIKDIEIVR